MKSSLRERAILFRGTLQEFGWGCSRKLRTASALLVFLFAPRLSCADVLKIVVNDTIQPITDEFIGRALAEAKAKNDQALLIEINTPGGLVESTREIIEKIVDSTVPSIKNCKVSALALVRSTMTEYVWYPERPRWPALLSVTTSRSIRRSDWRVARAKDTDS